MGAGGHRIDQTHETPLSEPYTGSWIDWPGGKGVFSAEASSWDSATVKLQGKLPGGGAIDIGDDVTFTANGAGGFIWGAGQIRVAGLDGAPVALKTRIAGID